jgi:hypothetical protein
MMFAQLLFYVRDARLKSETIPPFLVVFDTEKAAILETSKALALFDDTEIKWPKSGSLIDKALAAQVAPYIEGYTVWACRRWRREAVDCLDRSKMIKYLNIA